MHKFDNLREEFENLADSKRAECAFECDTEEAPQEEYPDFVRELTLKMMAPAKCGVYFSKKDIREIGRSFGEMIALKPRERMLKDLLGSVHDAKEMENLFDLVKNHIDLKLAVYDELSDTFGRSRPFFETRKRKAHQLKAALDRILDEIKNESPL